MGNKEEVALNYIRHAANACVVNGISMERALYLFERELLIGCLSKCGNNQHALADLEGVHRNTISRKMRRLKIDPPFSWQKRITGGDSYVADFRKRP